jgi:Ca2+:H+ antiporter
MVPGEPNNGIEADENALLLPPATPVDVETRPPTTLLGDIWTVLCSSYINVLIVFVPFALISGALEWSPQIVFITNFLALMPLAALLSYGTEELSKTAGSAWGSLLNVTFGNATELIIGIVALRNKQVKLIQTTMLGSILSSLLFVMQPHLAGELTT